MVSQVATSSVSNRKHTTHGAVSIQRIVGVFSTHEVRLVSPGKVLAKDARDEVESKVFQVSFLLLRFLVIVPLRQISHYF